jgi:general secretion pathway protein D
MPKRRNSKRALVILIAVVSAGLTATGEANLAQERPLPQMPEEERRKLLQTIRDQAQKAQEAQKAQQGTAPGAQPVTPGAPGAQPVTPGAPVVVTTTAPPPPLVKRAPLAANQVQLSYDNADLYEFINQIADALGITPIVLDPQIKGSVTIHSSAPMSRDDIFPLFNLILKNNNAAMVKQGNIYQIVPISDALKRGLETIEHLPPEPVEQPKEERPAAAKPDPAPGSAASATQAPAQPAAPPPQAPAQPAPQAPAQPSTPPGAPAPQTAPPAGQPQAATPSSQQSSVSRLATHVIRPEFVPVRDLIDPLKLFMTDGAVVMPYDRLNMLILTDYSDGVQKIIDLVRLLDNSYLNADLIELINIKYNASADVADDLKKIFGSGTKDSSTGISFLSLDRLNSILVMASSKRALGEVKRWIEKLDATTGRSIQTHIYVVENSTAANIAAILGALYGGEGGSVSGDQRGAPGGPAGQATPFGAGRGGTQAGAPGSSPQGAATPFGGGGGGTFGGGGPFGGGMGGGGGFYGGGGGGFAGQGQYGFGGGMGGAFGTGQQLGPRLNPSAGTSAQVFRGGSITGLQDTVRVVVDEINNSLIVQSSAADYAYILEVIKKLDVLPRQVIIDARVFEIDLTDAFTFGVAATLQARGAGPHLTTGSINGTSGLVTNTFAFVGNSRELLLALDTLRQKTKVKILEAPAVLALDGTQASIVVGGEVPYPTGSYIPGVSGGTVTNVQYRETGVTLLVVPRISGSGTVTLAVAQEVSAPGASGASDLGPTFTKSSVSTTLAVQDGETVAIAGLIRDNTNTFRSGVPLLSDIPVVGALFGRTNRSANRTELLILITPHVIKTPERFQELTQELKDSLRNVRKHVDDKQDEHLKDMEDAQKERIRREEKLQKKSETQKSETRNTEPQKSEATARRRDD